MNSDSELKKAVQQYWDVESCGEVYATGASAEEQFASQAFERYKLEPYIVDFAKSAEGRAKDVLEIGTGMGADHVEWAKAAPRRLIGIDLTPRAVSWTAARMIAQGKPNPGLLVADAEQLPFRSESFDIVSSWGVLHHTPDTRSAFAEVLRVLRPGGVARVSVYHRPSIVGMMLWVRYGLFRLRPWRSLSKVASEHLESPGTKTYTIEEGKALAGHFSQVHVSVRLSFGDLLLGSVGQRHNGPLLSVAKRCWPRSLIRRFGSRFGLWLLIDAVK